MPQDADESAMAKHLAWLDATAYQLEREAAEAEALANGRALAGSLNRQYHFSALGRIEEKRSRAAEYRRKAMALRIEETKRRRASA